MKRAAKVKLPETHVRRLVLGQEVIINLPDLQIHITMDMTRSDLRKAADKLRNLGTKQKSSKYEDLFNNSFEDIFGSGPFSDLFK